MNKLGYLTTRMHLEGMLGTVSQRKRNNLWFHLYAESEKTNNRQTFKQNGQLVTMGGGGWGEVGEGDKDVRTSNYKIILSQGWKNYSIGTKAHNIVTSLYGGRW